jgi:DNA-binding GntR family transcriptional regulator
VLAAMREGDERKVMELIDAHLRAAIDDLTRRNGRC